MATTWGPATPWRYPRHTWVFANGDVAQTPEIEESGTGRRFRLVGETKSHPRGDYDSIMHQHIADLAANRGTTALLAVPADDNDRLAELLGPLGLGINDLGEAPDIDQVTSRRGFSSALFTFAHPTLPLEAAISVALNHHYNDYYSVTTQMSFRPLHDHYTRPNVQTRTSNTLPVNYMPYGDPGRQWSYDHENDPEALPNIPWGYQRADGYIPAVMQFVAAVNKVANLDSVAIPDFVTDPTQPRWMSLDRAASNVDEQALADLRDAAAVGPAMEKLAAISDDVLATLRRIGVVVEAGPNQGALAKAARTGDLTGFEVQIRPTGETPSDRDDTHQVYINLALGMVHVSCTHGSVDDRNAAAQAYDNAKFLADIRGDGDEFLTYTRRYLSAQAERGVNDAIRGHQAVRADIDQATA
jgi:hypothetical protein